MVPQDMQDTLKRIGHFGWVPPHMRTNAQHDANARALAAMPKFALQYSPPPFKAGTKTLLTDSWKSAVVVVDLGKPFTGFFQVTGSCVGASSGIAVCTLSCIQRLLAVSPTKAYIPFWPWEYGITRTDEGDRGEGEGAVDSVMGETLAKKGSLEATQPGLPQFDTSDGFKLTKAIEMSWSDGASSVVTKWNAQAAPNTVGTVAPLSSVADIKAAIQNGYPVLDGCNDYVGHGAVQGSGDDAAVVGAYDGQGGHSTSVLGYWDNQTLGPLYLYCNNWAGNTYPSDPAGGGRCCVWLKESTMEKLFTMGGGSGETMALSHLKYFPAQPAILDWSQL
jgi:hypothetical protein